MPKMKLSPISEASEIVMRNICALAQINGYKTDAAIAKKLGISAPTFSLRRQKPQTLRLEEIVKASMAFKCSLAWLVTDHRGEFKDEA